MVKPLFEPTTLVPSRTGPTLVFTPTQQPAPAGAVVHAKEVSLVKSAKEPAQYEAAAIAPPFIDDAQKSQR